MPTLGASPSKKETVSIRQHPYGTCQGLSRIFCPERLMLVVCWRAPTMLMQALAGTCVGYGLTLGITEGTRWGGQAGTKPECRAMYACKQCRCTQSLHSDPCSVQGR